MADIKIKESVLFDGLNKGFEYNGSTFRLACGPSLAQAPNGDLLCSWLTGSKKEPAPDNCLAVARSTDGGKTWGEPQMLVPPGDENGSGFIQRCGDKLVFMEARWPMEYEYTVWNYVRRESTDNGYTWSEAEPVKLFEEEGLSCAICNQIKTQNGEYLVAAQIFKKREKPLTAGAVPLAFAQSEEEAYALHSRLPGEGNPGKFATHLHGCGVFATDAENKKFEFRGWVHNRPLGLLEPTMLELKDGTLTMLMRAEMAGFLWRSDSNDGGRTWCDAYRTDIPNPTTQAHMTRLADGRIALVNNNFGGVIGEPLRLHNRDPLSVWISDDELKSFSLKKDVITGGALSYPYGMVLQDGRFVFAYDHNRNQVRFVEVEL